jgi:DNA-binding transcriptional MerR regulator
MVDPYDDPTNLLTARQAADLAGVQPVTIRQWAHRGLLPIARNKDGVEQRNGRGQPLYWRLDVAKAEFKTRKRARRAA